MSPTRLPEIRAWIRRAASRSCVTSTMRRYPCRRRRGQHVAGEIIHRRVDAAALDRYAGRRQAKLDAGKRSDQLRLVDVGEMTNAEDLARHLAKARAERDVEALEDGLAHVVGIDAVG